MLGTGQYEPVLKQSYGKGRGGPGRLYDLIMHSPFGSSIVTARGDRLKRDLRSRRENSLRSLLAQIKGENYA